jgi:transcriptional regulator with XRE-family HTH domain
MPLLTAAPDLNKIRRLRVIKFRTQVAFAARIGSSQSWVSEIESGRKRPSLAKMCDMADALEVEVDEIILADDLAVAA